MFRYKFGRLNPLNKKLTLRNWTLLIVSFQFCFCFAQSKLLSVEGYFQGKNLIVFNPALADGYGFSVYKVTVNGDILPATIQATNFEINFSLFDIKRGDKVFVVLEHDENSQPKFMNPEVLLPKSTFECTNLTLVNDNTLIWNTINEQGVLDFRIEQFKWGRWVETGQVKGFGTKDRHSYSFQLNPHSGKNKVRVTQLDNSGEKRKSNELIFDSKQPKVKKTPSKVSDYIYFNSKGKQVKTNYEIYDAYGNLLKIGFSNKVDCTNLVNGIYFVNFDNVTEKFIKTE